MSRKTILPFQQAPQSICVLRLSAIGDICHTVPVINAIRDQWPETKITWIIGELEASLVGDLPGIEFVIYDKKEGRAGRKKIKAALAGRQFDVLLHMQISLRSSMIARTINAKIKLGFDKPRAKDYQWLFTNVRIPHKPRQHVMNGLFGFAETIGVKRPVDNKLHWDIPLHSEHLQYAASKLNPRQPTVVLSPCSSQRSRNFRNWSVDNYIAACRHAIQQHDAQIVLTGGASDLEREYSEQISAALPYDSTVNLVAQTSLKELYAIIGKAQAVLCPDSGPAHMANSLRVPVIGLYATSNPLRTGPYFSTRSGHIVNAYPQACENFLNKSPDQVPWGARVRSPEALDLITVEEICERIDAVLTL